LLWKRWADSRLLDLLAATVAVLMVAAPLLFTNSGFALDFTNHLWLSWIAGKAFIQLGHPTYFVNTSNTGVFYPHFAFYGGTLYVITGVLGELMGGHPILSYVLITTLAIAGAYGGMLWLGRQLGLSRWLSHMPALVVITSAYFVSDLYGRGAWTEVVATSAIPPMLASALHLTRAPRWQPLPVLAFIASTVIFTGSHNITLLCGTTAIAVSLGVLWIAMGRPRNLPYRRLGAVLALGFVSLLVSAWFLIPNLSYAKDVRASLETALGSEGYASYRAYIAPILVFDPPGVLFNPLRSVPKGSTVPALYVQIPEWFLIWALLAGWLLLLRPPSSRAAPRRGPPDRARRRSGGRARAAAAARGPSQSASASSVTRTALLRAWIAFAALLASLLLMIMINKFWTIVPFPYAALQFPFRLNTYVFYMVSALVLIGALALQRASANGLMVRTTKRLRVGLIVVCAISIALCIWQEWVPNTLYTQSYKQRGASLSSVNTAPHSWYDTGSFNDSKSPLVPVSPNRVLVFNPQQVHGDRFSGWVNVPPGMEPIQTNIAGGPYLVHISGLTRVGDNETGFAVVRRSKNGSGPVHVVIETNHSARIVFGWVLSILATVIILVVLAWTSWASFRDRRFSSSAQAS
jgi:hypothetical protein